MDAIRRHRTSTSGSSPVRRLRGFVREHARFAWTLSVVMPAIYLGFVLPVAFAEGLLATEISSSITFLGIVLGSGVIVAALVLTGICVRRA